MTHPDAAPLYRHYTTLALRAAIGARNTTGQARARYQDLWRHYTTKAIAALAAGRP